LAPLQRDIGSELGDENSTLKQFHPEAEFINLEHRREIDRVFTTAKMSDLLDRLSRGVD
jgi:hypothetical protein